MQRNWYYYTRTLIVGFFLCLFIGWMIGSVAWVLVAGLAAYLFWMLSQAYRMHRWLYSSRAKEPPESKGLWGDLFDGIHQLQIQHFQSSDRLKGLIKRIQQSTNALKDAVIMTDSAGSMDWWNQSAERLLGFKRHADRGQLIQNLIRNPNFKLYFNSKDYSEPLLMTGPSNPNLQLQIHITLFGKDDRLIVVQDVTRLFRLEQMRRDFVSNVSHELRTPLTVISGYLETFIDHGDDLAPRWKRGLNQMEQQTQRMEALVNDLLLLSKIEGQGQNTKFITVDIKLLLQGIIEDAIALSGDKNHKIELHTASSVDLNGDELQLHSAFSNIVFNAVKYTPEKGTIIIKWSHNDNGAHLAIEDSGVGMDPIHIPRLTERFYRADPSRTPETGGTGLGLAIVKHVLLNHEGTLEIKSQLGKGSSFICHFPTHRIAENEEPLKRLML